MIILVSLNYKNAHDWCHRQDPPIPPNDIRRVCIVSTSDPCAVEKLRGRTLADDTKIMWDGLWWEGRNANDVADQLRMMEAFRDAQRKQEQSRNQVRKPKRV